MHYTLQHTQYRLTRHQNHPDDSALEGKAKHPQTDAKEIRLPSPQVLYLLITFIGGIQNSDNTLLARRASYLGLRSSISLHTSVIFPWQDFCSFGSQQLKRLQLIKGGHAAFLTGTWQCTVEQQAGGPRASSAGRIGRQCAAQQCSLMERGEATDALTTRNRAGEDNGGCVSSRTPHLGASGTTHNNDGPCFAHSVSHLQRWFNYAWTSHTKTQPFFPLTTARLPTELCRSGHA